MSKATTPSAGALRAVQAIGRLEEKRGPNAGICSSFNARRMAAQIIDREFGDLAAALEWAMGHVQKPLKLIRGQNDAHVAGYNAARAALNRAYGKEGGEG